MTANILGNFEKKGRRHERNDEQCMLHIETKILLDKQRSLALYYTVIKQDRRAFENTKETLSGIKCPECFIIR